MFRLLKEDSVCVCIWRRGQLKALRLCRVNIVFRKPHVLHKLLKGLRNLHLCVIPDCSMSWPENSLHINSTRSTSSAESTPKANDTMTKASSHKYSHQCSIAIYSFSISFYFPKTKNITLIVPELILRLDLNWKWRNTTSLRQLKQIFPLKTHLCTHIWNLLKVWILLTQFQFLSFVSWS